MIVPLRYEGLLGPLGCRLTSSKYPSGLNFSENNCDTVGFRVQELDNGIGDRAGGVPYLLFTSSFKQFDSDSWHDSSTKERLVSHAYNTVM
jgi:hypothetical protein